MILKVAFLDIYHGDCEVITFDEGGRPRCIVVDGGESRDSAFRLNAWLRHEEVRTIDLLVATHIDADHVNGLVNLLERFSSGSDDWNQGRSPCIEHYWGPLPDPDWTPHTHTMPATEVGLAGFSLLSVAEVAFVAESVRQNQSLARLVRERMVSLANMRYPSLVNPPDTDLFQQVEIGFLSPDRQIVDTAVQRKALSWENTLELEGEVPEEALPSTIAELEALVRANAARAAEIADRDANNQSIVFRLRPKGDGGTAWSFLFTGDAQQDAWNMMLDRHQPEDLQARVLKVPHHGSHRNGIIPEALNAINPEYCVVSVGQKHGLPHAETLNLLRGTGERSLFCTERNNSRSKRGPCGQKSACPRRTKRQFRSLLMEVDTETDQAQFHLFTITPTRGRVSWKPGPIWCPETQWAE